MIGNQVRRLAKDEVVFLEGDPGDCAYLIEFGSVLVSLTKDGEEIPIRVMGEGEVFGEMSLIDDSPRSATVRAMVETQVIVVTKDQLVDRVNTADAVVRLLMRALLSRLRSNNLNMRKHLSIIEAQNNGSAEQDQNGALDQIRLENRISAALDDNQFLPFYQPICDLRTGDVLGCEALIRWISPDGNVILPSLFMDTVEGSSLMLRAGQVMIDKCFNDMGKYLKADPKFFVSINISGRQFSDPNFIGDLERSRKAHQIDAAGIKLEVTERVMMEGPQALTTLQTCHSLGYPLAIDDFGTGFSSLQYLAAMPLTDLKIDRTFVMNMQSNEKSLKVIKSLIHLANLLGMNLIAEGIETLEQLHLLGDLGVAMGQGYLFAPPLPFDQFIHWAQAEHQSLIVDEAA